MYTLRINYSGGQHRTYDDIVKVEYQNFMEDVTVSGEEILTHKFTPNHDLHLFSKHRNYLVSHQGVVGIEVL
jgi:hypothetical protein